MRLRPSSLVLPVVVAAVVLVFALALGKSAGTPAPSSSGSSAVVKSGHTTVKIYMYAYEPRTLTVKVGTKITFTNMDMTAHTATALNEDFDTGTIQPGHSATIVVKKPGTYPYHCLFHAFMTATLKVVS